METAPGLLVLKYLQGTIDPEEKALLLDWVNENEANKKEFEETAALWKLTAKAPAKEFSPDNDREQFQQKLVGFEPQAKEDEINAGRQLYLQNPWLIGITAGIGLVMVFFFSFNDLFSKNDLNIIATSSSQIKEISLPDGSRVWINENSRISYRPDFKGHIRAINLEGEAYFEVAKDETKPFIVHTGNVTTRVLGTSFNLKSAPENKTEITVFSGKVSFYSREQENAVLLTKGMKGVFIPSMDSVWAVADTDPNVLAWQSDLLVFDNTPLKEVVEILSSKFKVQIDVANKDIYSCKFTSTFKKASLQEILNVLALSLNLNYTQEDTIYTLKGSGC